VAAEVEMGVVAGHAPDERVGGAGGDREALGGGAGEGVGRSGEGGIRGAFAEQDVHVLLGDQALVGEHEGMAASGLAGQGRGDPGLLQLSRGVDRVGLAVGTQLVRGGELVDQDEPGIIEIEAVRQPLEVGAGGADGGELGAQAEGGPALDRRRLLGAIGVAKGERPGGGGVHGAALGLGEQVHELRGRAVIVIAAAGEEPDPVGVEGLGEQRAGVLAEGRRGGVSGLAGRAGGLIGQVAHLKDEFDFLGDELAVELGDQSHRAGIRVHTIVQGQPLGIPHDRELPGGTGRRGSRERGPGQGGRGG